ncbi:MAG: hypothetical protein RM338_11600 [Nostoc sp. DedQUE12a]|nr:hypothetical protein [Nostoc sp. DedQUE12a]
MLNKSQLTWRSHIDKIFQTLIHGICLSPIIYYFYWLLFIGNISEITCQDVDLIRIDCTLKYQGVLQSSKQNIKNVKNMDIETRISSSEGETTTYYVAVLRSLNGKHDIKTYSIRSDELENINYNFHKFINNPQEKIVISLKYNRWQPLVDILNIFIFLIVSCVIFILFVILFIFVVLILNSICQILK